MNLYKNPFNHGSTYYYSVLMKGTASALTLILAFILVLNGMQLVNLVKGNADQAQTMQLLEPKPRFNFDLLYTYIQDGTDNCLVYNITCTSDLPSSSETIIEVYKIEIFSEGHLIGSSAVGLFVGNLPIEVIMGLTISLPATHSEISNAEPHTSYLRTTSIPFEHDFDADLDLTGTISTSVKRLGWITVDGDSVDRDLSRNELIKEFQLEKFGNGFLYNVLVPSEQMSQIDLLNPLDSFNPNLPSPSPKPQQGPEPFPTSYSMAFVTLIILALLSSIVYILKRRVDENPVQNLNESPAQLFNKSKNHCVNKTPRPKVTFKTWLQLENFG
jgi:hypothetical protein